MTDTPVFQGHHVIEQDAYAQSRLLRALSGQGLFDLHGPRNLLNLPADQALGARLGGSPHPGGPLGEYSKGVLKQLNELQETPDGQGTLRGDRAAAERMAARVVELTDTLKTGLVNGDLVTNTPQGMTRNQANGQIREFFGDLDGYRQTHATQIAEIAKMPAQEARWAGVTRSEGNVAATLDAIEQPGVKPVAGDPAAGRQSLGTAVAQANDAGRLPLSESMEVRLRAIFPNEMPPTLVRAPLTTEARGPLVEGGAVLDADAPRSGAPASGRAMRVVGAAGVALMAYDFASTGHRVLELRAQGNEAAAEAAETRFIGRNAGGLLVGMGAGFAYGAATGSWAGPGALLTGVIGGGVGAYLGDQWADKKQLEQINIQTDGSNNEWTRNPKGEWLREESLPNATGGYDTTRLLAVGRLVDELNYKAANDSYSLGLANPPDPQNPFRLDASASTQPPRAPFETGRDYERDAKTGQWQIEIREVLDGRIPMTRHEPVSIERATELERQSALIVANNAANTPAVTAARYQIAYDQFGWKEFASVEPVPDVIRSSAAQTQILPASDGNTYARGVDGEWTTPGAVYGTNQASGNLREELNRTWQSQQVGLQELSGYAAIARENPTPTEYGLRNAVADAYSRADVMRSDADIDAATRAVAQDHARDGLGQSPYTLERQSNGSIATLVGRDDRRMEIKSVTTAAEIERAKTHLDVAPHAIERTSEQGRDVREQAAREANRQGLSQEDVQLAAAAAVVGASTCGPSVDNATRVAERDRDEASPQDRRDRAQTVPAASPLPADFAPSQQGLRDLRDPQHEGHHALSEMQHRARLFETQQHIPHGPHTERLGAEMLAFAVENKFQYSNVRLVKDQDTGQIQLEHARYGHPTQRFPADLAAMSSQPIEATSQRINEAVSRHNAQPALALERTHEQAQAMSGYRFDDKVLFGFIRAGTPGHISDDHVALAARMAKENGINANNIARVSMVDDQIRMVKSGPDEKSVLVDVSKPAAPLQDSVNAVNTLNQQQAQVLAQQQDQPTQDGPGRGPKIM